MVEERVDNRWRTGADVRAHPGGLHDVHRSARAGDENLGLEFVISIDLDDVADQFHAGRRDVVDAADEGADIARADLRGQQRLRGRKAQGDVDLDALARQRLAGFDAVLRERHLHDDPRIDLREIPSLLDHGLRFGLDDLGAGGSLDDLADLLQVVAIVSRLLREQRRIRRDAVDDPERHERLDVLQIARIDEQFHDLPPPDVIAAASAATGLVSSPRPATVIVTLSPGVMGPTPDGVPVAMMSPGSSVMTRVMYAIRKSIENTSCAVVECCRRSPLTQPSTPTPASA